MATRLEFLSSSVAYNTVPRGVISITRVQVMDAHVAGAKTTEAEQSKLYADSSERFERLLRRRKSSSFLPDPSKDVTPLTYEIIGSGSHDVVYLHGNPGCAGMLCVSESLCSRMDLRIISVSRPGFGNTPEYFIEGRRHTIEEMIDHYVNLLNSLGVKTFSVVSWSIGGIYTSHLLNVCAHRIRRVVMLSPAWPLDTAEGKNVLRGLGKEARAQYVISKNLTVKFGGLVYSSMAFYSPRRMFKGFKMGCVVPAEHFTARNMPDALQEWLGGITRRTKHGGATGRAVMHEDKLWMKRWPTYPRDLKGKYTSDTIRFYVGNKDTIVPPSASRCWAHEMGLDTDEVVIEFKGESHITLVWPHPFGVLDDALAWISKAP